MEKIRGNRPALATGYWLRDTSIYRLEAALELVKQADLLAQMGSRPLGKPGPSSASGRLRAEFERSQDRAHHLLMSSGFFRN